MCGFGIGLSWGVANAMIDTETVFPIIETEDYYAEGKFVPGEYWQFHKECDLFGRMIIPILFKNV